MKLALWLVCVAPATALASGDAPSWRPPAPASAPMPADDDVPVRVTGAGRIREARALLVDDRYAVAVETAAGPSTVALALGHDFGLHEYTLTRMELRDVIGDPDPELYLELDWFHDPCGCDDGPTFTAREVVVCRVSNDLLQCSQAVPVAGSEHVDERRAWSAELAIDRRGLVRRTVTERQGLTRGDQRRLERPVRLRFGRR